MREALRIRLEQVTQFQRSKGLRALHLQPLGEHELVIWMTATSQAFHNQAEPPCFGPRSNPDSTSAEATPHDDPPPARAQAIIAACGTYWDGKALHTPTEEKYYTSWDIFILRISGMVNTFP
eukprot:2077788-Pyramimonas_sp.AAC.1